MITGNPLADALLLFLVMPLSPFAIVLGLMIYHGDD